MQSCACCSAIICQHALTLHRAVNLVRVERNFREIITISNFVRAGNDEDDSSFVFSIFDVFLLNLPP